MMNLSLPMANATPGKPRLTKVPRAIPVASVVLAFLVGATAAHAGAIRRVPTEYATIKAAVIAAETGDSILIAPGTYTGAENRAIDVGLKTLYIRGTGGAGTVVIDAENVANCFSFANSPFHYTSLQGLRLRRGNPCGIYVYDAAPVIMDSSIEDCVTGMLLARYHGTPSGLTIDGCVSTALKVSTGSNCEIRNSTIQNSAGAYGAGVQIIGASLLVANCVIRGNDASSDGGAVYCESGGVVLQDVAITGNRCAGAGGGIRLLNSSATLEYTTLSRNLAVSAAGGVSSAGSSSVVGHSILWGNCAPLDGREIHLDSGSSATFDCSAVDQSGVGGTGGIVYEPSVIFSDPLFCDMGSCADPPTSLGDFYLATGSPCAGGPCGYVGHLSTACGETPVARTTWGAIRAAFR